MRTGTINNYIKFSKNFGGVRKCYEGKPTIAVGGFSCDPELMPAYPNVMAAGTLVYADEQARTIVPLYTFKVKSVDSTNSKITIEKYETGTIAKVGMKLIAVGDDLTQSTTNVYTVSAIDSSADDVDVLTVDAVTGVTEGTVLAECVTTTTGEGNDAVTTNLVKVIPNGLTYCDNVLDPDAYAIDIDYIWNCMEKPVLERRMPPLTASLKKALRDNECYFRFSNRK
ncbi:MAG: hypothetical protein IJV13_08775 [Prevotella sp.]|nr:hypothetical protein [Prevotella sp.]